MTNFKYTFQNFQLYVNLVCFLGIFAKRYIESNEELCFSYGEINSFSSEFCDGRANQFSNRKLCKCLSEKCKKYLPNL